MNNNPLKIDWPTCEQCGAAHDPELPHLETMEFQTKFFARTGRPPTYGDTMAHCQGSVQLFFEEALRQTFGVSLADELQMRG